MMLAKVIHQSLGYNTCITIGLSDTLVNKVWPFSSAYCDAICTELVECNFNLSEMFFILFYRDNILRGLIEIQGISYIVGVMNGNTNGQYFIEIKL